jgi:hypothetical protein
MILGLCSLRRLRNRRRCYLYRVFHLQTGWRFKRLCPELLQHVDVSAHFVFVRAKNNRGVIGDQIGFVSFEQGLIEAVPAECAPRFDDFLKSAILAFAVKQCLACAQTASHDFREQQAATTNLAHQPLADNVTQGIGETLTKHLFFVFSKHSENAVDRLARIDGVKGGKDEMTGLRRGHRDLHRHAIANFADQDHLRCLAQRGAKTGGEIGKIFAKLALMKDGAMVRMQKLNGIFERDNVNWFRVIYFVEHGGERGGFATASAAGDEDNAGPFLDDFAKNRW